MTRWLPSLNALRAFESVARHLSYPLAAEELGVTPAAVKQLVYRLEATLDTPLVRREGRGLALTSAGQAGLDDLSVAMGAMGKAVERMRGTKTAPRLVVSVEASLASTWLVPKLEAFRAQHPGIAVLIDSSQEVADLHGGGADIGIRYGVAARDDLVIRRLFDDLIFPVCSPALAKGLIHLSDLERVPLIHWDTSRLDWARNTRRWFDWTRWFDRIGAEPVLGSGALSFSDYGQAVQAAIAGQGVVLASGPLLHDTLATGHLVRPLTETLHTEIGYDLATAPVALRRPEVRAFIDWMMEVAQAGNPDATPLSLTDDPLPGGHP